jgi:hypothetical protein
MQRALYIIAFLAAAMLSGTKAFAMDDAAFCATVTAEANSENSSAPYEIDAATKGAGATFDCAAKKFDSKRTVNLNLADLTAGWQDTLTEAWSKVFCSEPAWKDGIAAGWVVNGDYTFADGTVFVATVKCP